MNASKTSCQPQRKTVAASNRRVRPFAALLTISMATFLCAMAFAPSTWADGRVVCPASACGGTGCSSFHDVQNAQQHGQVYPTIGAAIAASNKGDQIEVCPGTYKEQVIIGMQLNLTGPSSKPNSDQFPAGQAVIAPPATPLATVVDPSTGATIAPLVLVQNVGNQNVNFSNFTIDGKGNKQTSCSPILVGLYYLNSSGQIQNDEVKDITYSSNSSFGCSAVTNAGNTLNSCPTGLGILADGNGQSQVNVQLQNNAVHDYQSNGITVGDPGTQTQIKNNIVTGCGPTGHVAQNGLELFNNIKQSDVENNFVSNHVFGGCVSISNCPAASTDVLVLDTNGNNQVEQNSLGEANVNVLFEGVSNHGEVEQNTITHPVIFYGVGLFPDPSFAATSGGNEVEHNMIFNSDVGFAAIAAGTGENNDDIGCNDLNGGNIGVDTVGSFGTKICGDNGFFNIANPIVDPPSMSAPGVNRY